MAQLFAGILPKVAQVHFSIYRRPRSNARLDRGHFCVLASTVGFIRGKVPYGYLEHDSRRRHKMIEQYLDIANWKGLNKMEFCPYCYCRHCCCNGNSDDRMQTHVHEVVGSVRLAELEEDSHNHRFAHRN